MEATTFRGYGIGAAAPHSFNQSPAQGNETVITYTREHVEQAYELGRVHERHKMADLASIGTAGQEIGRIVAPSAVHKPRAAVVAAQEAPKAPKTPKVSRGVRASAGPREKGVKEGIMNLIRESANGMTTGDLISATGFKPTSINATLMGLQKEGKISKSAEGKLWTMNEEPTTHESGNSEAEYNQDYAQQADY